MESETLTTFPTLFKSFKQRFAFRLSVPSFIYPAGYVENVRLLAPFVDEIELLLFESDENCLPDKSEIDKLAALASTQDISYNVHLPLDLNLADIDLKIRRQNVERLSTAIERVRPLSPTTHTLHLPFNEADTTTRTIEKWILHNRESLYEILAVGNVNPENISIETLDYSPFWLETLVAEMDLAVCIDIGHLLRYGYNLEAAWSTFCDRTTMIHLHGVHLGKDHLALDQMTAEKRERIQKCLSHYTDGLSLEVFSFDRITASLPYLAKMFPPDSEENIIRLKGGSIE